MIQKKICLLGSFAVGKTSLVARFVHSTFSDKYLTTVGVKVDRKALQVDSVEVNLLLWDIHGEDEFQKVRSSYLRGAAGYFLVLDGTRTETVDTVEYLHDLARSEVGDVPFQILINKSDIQSEWRLQGEHYQRLATLGGTTAETSAKTGAGVETVFDSLARAILQHTYEDLT